MTNGELETVLVHCRALVGGAAEVDSIRFQRSVAAERALIRWTGPHADNFAARVAEEEENMRRRADSMRDEADEWADLWAEIVNRINFERRQAAVAAVRERRSFGEGIVDLFIGDDSDQQVRPYRPVSPPKAYCNFLAAGGLERFD